MNLKIHTRLLLTLLLLASLPQLRASEGTKPCLIILRNSNTNLKSVIYGDDYRKERGDSATTISAEQRALLDKLFKYQNHVLERGLAYDDFMRRSLGIQPASLERELKKWIDERFIRTVGLMSRTYVTQQEIAKIEVHLSALADDISIMTHNRHELSALEQRMRESLRDIAQERAAAPVPAPRPSRPPLRPLAGFVESPARGEWSPFSIRFAPFAPTQEVREVPAPVDRTPDILRLPPSSRR